MTQRVAPGQLAGDLAGATVRVVVEDSANNQTQGPQSNQIGQPAARSLAFTRSTMTCGRDSISALTRTTTHPIASTIAIRSMSHDR